MLLSQTVAIAVRSSCAWCVVQGAASLVLGAGAVVALEFAVVVQVLVWGAVLHSRGAVGVCVLLFLQALLIPFCMRKSGWVRSGYPNTTHCENFKKKKKQSSATTIKAMAVCVCDASCMYGINCLHSN